MKKLLVVFSFFCSLNIQGQESDDELDPVTVTGTLQPRQVSGTGRNIVIIKGERFANLPVHSVDELLRYLPGVEVQMRGPMGSQSDIVLRGGTFQQVLILLDGVRVNDPNTGHFNSYIPVTPGEIDRIEILKGASSAIYGSDAVGGVIQVITKTFAAAAKKDKKWVSAQVSAGEYGLLHINTGLFYQHNKTSVGAGWLSNHSNGQIQRGTRGYVDANTISVSMSHQFNKDLQLSARVAYDHRDFAAQNFYTSFASDTANEQVSSGWAQLRLIYAGLPKHRLVVDASYKDVRDEYAFTSHSIPNESTSNMLQLNLRDEWKLSDKTSLVSGTQLLNKKISSNDRGEHSLNQAGLFLLLDQKIGKWLSINPALRLEWNKLSGAEFVPQVNLAYQVRKFHLRAGAGKTIRDADFTERFNNYNKALVTSGRVGNPQLEAERSASYEAGADLVVARLLKLSVTAFRREHRKLIDYVVTPYEAMPRKENLKPGAVYALASNIARVRTNGLEFDLSYRQQLAGKAGSVTAGVGFVWLDSKSSDSVPSFYVSSHARNMLNFFIEDTTGQFSISFNGVYKTRLTQKADPIQAALSRQYFLVSAKASYSFLNNKVNCFAQVNNISNLQYSDLLGAVMPGRWVSAGARFTLTGD